MSYGVVIFAERSQVMGIMPFTECEGLGVVELLGQSMTGLNGALRSMLLPNHSLNSYWNMSGSSNRQTFTYSLFLFRYFFFAPFEQFQQNFIHVDSFPL
ncbi:MAG: hypothetical protein WC924_02055 [Candidatus Gracilibacteria bacterium]